MGIHVTDDRLQELYRLRTRVALEIQQEERRLAEHEAARIKPPKSLVHPSSVRRAPSGPVSPSQVRAWAVANGFEVGERGRIREDVWDAYTRAHR